MPKGWTKEHARHSLAAKGVRTERVKLWHKTTRSRADKIMKEGFKLEYRGTGAKGGSTDVPGISFGWKGYAISDEYMASDLKTDVTDIVKIYAIGDLHILDDDYYAHMDHKMSPKDYAKKVMAEGYDAIRYPGGEIIVLDPKKVKPVSIY